MLKTEEIAKLASRKGVRAIAVSNFLSSLHGSTASDAWANLRMDARLYNWNAATQKAIGDGITKHFR